MPPPTNEQVTFPPQPPPGPLAGAAELREAHQDREAAGDEVVVAELMAEHGLRPVLPPEKPL